MELYISGVMFNIGFFIFGMYALKVDFEDYFKLPGAWFWLLLAIFSSWPFILIVAYRYYNKKGLQ